ncbi:MAG: 4-(cytidine 5'-diphospho)-2-C-methyl-D-erythritol kinase [Acidobacteria bacterium]|nr:MAG: 4-(cytidine 5'-diphospho)-2-C-methyl-D-erythritol kinase [Acidobacteriota bacterium]
MIWKAHAKLNLYLRITGRLETGFHSLETVFQEIDLHDELIWKPEPHNGFQLHVDGPDLGPLESNLVYKAVKLFSAESSICVHGKLILKKKIPHGGGLGGGSSDAAATLSGMNRYYKSPLSEERLRKLAAELGSDVPFFLQGGTCRAQGRGELLQPTELASELPRRGFLFIPPCPAPTAQVYQAYAQSRPAVWQTRKKRQKHISWGRNDLTEAACAVQPNLKSVRDVLRDSLPRELIFMTGSGSTWVWLTEKRQVPHLPFPFEVRQIPFQFES